METSREGKISKRENKLAFQKDRKELGWNMQTERLGSKAHRWEEWTSSSRRKMDEEVAVVHAKKVGGLAERNKWESLVRQMRGARLWSPDKPEARSAAVVGAKS
jgi:hypothetical protein